MRDFTYIDDCVEALMLAAVSDAADGRIFNLGGYEKSISLQELAEMLISVNGSGHYVCKDFPSDRKRIDIGDYYSSSDLIAKTLGWKPLISAEEGLKRTLDYYRQHLQQYI